MTSFLGQTKLNKGIRNNNPGNLVKTGIVWQGKIPHSKNTDPRFEQFTTIEYGIRAMLRDIVNDINKGNNTITKLIHQYAPSFENDTLSYINDVSKGLGIAPDDKIRSVDNVFLLKIAKAVIKKENAPHHTYVKDSHIKTAINMLGTFEKSAVKVNIKTDIMTALIVPVLLFFLTVFTISL